MTASTFHQASSTKYASDIDVSGFHTPRVSQVVGTPLNASTGDLAATAGTATLAGNADGSTVYCSGFEITGGGATGASVVQATITGLTGGTLTLNVPVPAGATLGIQPLVVEFNPAIPASAINTNIVLNLPSFGAGNAHAAGNIHGYRV